MIFVSLVPVCASEVSHAKFRTLNGKHASFTPRACSLTPGHFFFESLLYFYYLFGYAFSLHFLAPFFYLLGVVFVSVQCYFKFLCYYFLSFAYALSLSGIVLRFLGIFFLSLWRYRFDSLVYFVSPWHRFVSLCLHFASSFDSFCVSLVQFCAS